MLSFDIQVEIIKRLPVKSVIQFRSVCKSWKSLIDSSHFINAGYNFCHDQPQHLMIRYAVGFGQEMEVKYVSFVDNDDDSFPQQKFSLTVPPLVEATIIMGSSHGLLCLIDYFLEIDDSCITSETGIAVLWNPTIRKSIAVVVPNNNLGDRRFSYVVGFGVCPDTMDPKLVKITYIYEFWKWESISCIPSQVMVFSLSSGEWTCLCSTNLPRKSIQFSYFQTVIGQFIYWLACDWVVVDRPCNLIMSFDMSTQEFREIELPDYLPDVCESDLSISRLTESLVVVDYAKDLTWTRDCTLWMMENRDSKVFTKLFAIKASVWSTLGFRKSGEPIVKMEDDNTLVVYDPCSEHIKDLGIHGNKYSFFGSFYTESLLLLNCDDGHIVNVKL